MQKATDITIIIPTYTNIDGFTRLVTALKTTTIPIIAIDNLPSPEKNQITKADNITYLPQQKNIGFAKAINLGIMQAKTAWALILNDDVYLPNDKIIKKLLDYAIRNSYSAVSPVLKNSRDNIENLGYQVLPVGKVELNFDERKTDQRALDGLTAACLLIKKSDFESMGGFDERFFAYLEDVDLFLRMKKKGYTFGVDLNTEVIHDKNSTSSKMGNFKQYHDLKNWILIIVKNWDKKTLLKYFPLIIIERLRNFSGYLKASIRT